MKISICFIPHEYLNDYIKIKKKIVLMCRRLTISDRKKEKFKPENSFQVTYLSSLHWLLKTINTMYSCVVLTLLLKGVYLTEK